MVEAPTAGSQTLWRHPEPTDLQWSRIVRASGRLESEIDVLPGHGECFAGLVGSAEMRGAPVHRWFTYKEGFAPGLLGAVIDALELPGPLRVFDAFGGVATSALAGQAEQRVSEVRSVEYSPFAHFAGQVKLDWHRVDPGRMRRVLARAVDYERRTDIPVPELAAFNNPEILHGATVQSLLSAREHLRAMAGVKGPERRLLLLGLAAVIEDLSGAMKDGRALRIKRERRRKPSSLAATEPLVDVKGRVKRALAGQWTAMIEDLTAIECQRAQAARTSTHHLRGDARHLARVKLAGKRAFPDGWAQLGLFSPPYLNFLDYTELYKLELWLLEHIRDSDEFRRVRHGTLRSHPSVRFKARLYFAGESGPEIDLLALTCRWVARNGMRRENGLVLGEYFEDMLQVWREQHRVLAPGGASVCVVANSTFSQRAPVDDCGMVERWRLPLLTDVLLAHLARRAGFGHVEIWPARELRPRNALAGHARESLVVAWKMLRG